MYRIKAGYTNHHTEKLRQKLIQFSFKVHAHVFVYNMNYAL